MNPSLAVLGDHWVSRVTLVLACACLYGGATLINNELLVPWLEFDRYRFLIFLPAGLKLLLVMIFGWQGVLGVAIGIASVTLNEFKELALLDGLAFGLVNALSTRLGLTLATMAFQVKYPWTKLKWWSLLGVAVVVGTTDALSFQASMIFLRLESVADDTVLDVAKAAFGRVTGALLFLGVFADFRRRLRRAAEEIREA